MHRNLFDYGFANVKRIKVIEKGSVIATRKINGTSVSIIATEDVEIPKVSEKRTSVTAKLHLKNITSYVNAGDFLGNADIYCNGRHIARVSVESGQKAQRISFIEVLKRAIFGKN